MKFHFILLFFVVISGLFAQLDERDILFRRAERYRVQQQFEKAIDSYQKLIELYPKDEEGIEKLITTFINSSYTKKAENLLKKKKEIISEILFVKLKILILLKDGNIKIAEKTAEKYIKKNSNRMNNYRLLANVFEMFKQYEFAIELMQKARNISDNKFLYAREIAINYQYLNATKNAVKEFLNFLIDNKNYSNYVLDRLYAILQKDPQTITTIGKIATASDKDYIKEIYALCLGELGKYGKALTVYRRLSPVALIRFAQRHQSLGNLEISKKAFYDFMEISKDLPKKADAQINIAEIYIEQDSLDLAKALLQKVKNNETIQKREYKYKTFANVQCRELLAEIELRQNGASKNVISILENAKKYANSTKENTKIDFMIVHQLTLNAQCDESKSKLDKMLTNQNSGSDIYKESFYYSFLNAFFQNNPEQDSLLTEIIINIPGDVRINDILFLANFMNNLQEEKVKSKFFEAYRKKLIYQEDEAIKILQNIYAEFANEEILMLAGEWAILAKNKILAKEIFSHKFENEILNEYSQLRLAKLEQNTELIRRFLNENSQSVFSPEFRKILEK